MNIFIESMKFCLNYTSNRRRITILQKETGSIKIVVHVKVHVTGSMEQNTCALQHVLIFTEY